MLNYYRYNYNKFGYRDKIKDHYGYWRIKDDYRDKIFIYINRDIGSRHSRMEDMLTKIIKGLER